MEAKILTKIETGRESSPRVPTTRIGTSGAIFLVSLREEGVLGPIFNRHLHWGEDGASRNSRYPSLSTLHEDRGPVGIPLPSSPLEGDQKNYFCIN